MAFTLSALEIDNFKQAISALTAVTDMATLYIKPDGIVMAAIDPAHVALVDINCDKRAFADYKCDKAFEIGVDLQELSRVIGRIRKDEPYTITASKSHLIIKTDDTSPREYKIRLTTKVDDSENKSSTLKRPKFNSSVKLELTIRELERCLGDMEVMGDVFDIASAKTQVTMGVKGLSGGVTIKLHEGDDVQLIDAEKPAVGTYTIEYIRSMIAALGSGSTNRVIIQYGMDTPIRFTFDLDNITIKYYVAPRKD